jgi:hypothetical protein
MAKRKSTDRIKVCIYCTWGMVEDGRDRSWQGRIEELIEAIKKEV